MIVSRAHRMLAKTAATSRLTDLMRQLIPLAEDAATGTELRSAEARMIAAIACGASGLKRTSAANQLALSRSSLDRYVCEFDGLVGALRLEGTKRPPADCKEVFVWLTGPPIRVSSAEDEKRYAVRPSGKHLEWHLPDLAPPLRPHTKGDYRWLFGIGCRRILYEGKEIWVPNKEIAVWVGFNVKLEDALPWIVAGHRSDDAVLKAIPWALQGLTPDDRAWANAHDPPLSAEAAKQIRIQEARGRYLDIPPSH